MKLSNIAAILVLLGMFFAMFSSSLDDSTTFDEVAHIGAGYTYLTQKDGRLNPEHPPLIKMVSALPLLFLNLNFDVSQPFWTMQNVNDRQWAAGNSLLYESGNNADKILFYSRLPIMLLAIIFGFILFWWTQKNYGASPAILTLLLFALSPTFLAHSRYVTTDLGAAFAFFASIIFFVKFLENNNKKSAIYFGIVFGLSLLVKFSLVILIPFFVVVAVGYLVFSKSFRSPEKLGSRQRRDFQGENADNRPALDGTNYRLEKIQGILSAIFIVLAIIYIFYIPLIWNYPLEQNLADAHYTLGGYKTAKFAPELVFTLLSNKFTQPLGQYFHGFLMAAQRTAGGNSAYFLGEVSNKGWIHYFPVLFFTKEQIGLYILMALAIIVNGINGLKGRNGIFFAFILYYWAWALWSPLTIGVRHILPTLPFIYILIAKPISEWGARFKKFFLAAIFIWMALEISYVFPYFLSYYNEFTGGWKNGYAIATDSNYDWGQDLKRLLKWVEKNKAEKIYLDYFGGGSPKYYLGEKYEFWRYEKGAPPAGSYFAVSINSLVGAEELYFWLKDKQPAARAGSSIFIYEF